MNMKAILFDLDGTLLPMDQDVFIRDYMQRLAAKMAPFGYEPKTLISAIWAGTGAMVKNDGSRTNEEVFWDSFCGAFGEKARLDEPKFEEFYRVEFQNVKNSCGCNEKAAQVIAKVKGKGLLPILATNPLFPAIATYSRTRWAGLDPADFGLITTYENSSHCKPDPDYYRDILKRMELKPEECVMVGNDVGEDMIAEALGMQVFLLTDCLINKTGGDISRYPNGSFDELLTFIDQIA